MEITSKEELIRAALEVWVKTGPGPYLPFEPGSPDWDYCAQRCRAMMAFLEREHERTGCDISASRATFEPLRQMFDAASN